MNDYLRKMSVERYEWANAPRNVIVTPRRFFFPADAEDLRKIIVDAESKGLRVRAVGSGHSYSEAPKGKDYLLSMKKMRAINETPVVTLKATNTARLLIDVGAGTVLKRLTRELDKKDLALPNMGAVDFQTISGAILTGTHGTGLNKPAMPDMVRSVKMVATGGELLQIEPTEGISNPAQFPAGGNLRLIQDDDTFYAVILGFGAMGIIYDLTLEVVAQFWMRETRYLRPWSKLKNELLDGSFQEKLENVDFVSFRVNPYRVKGDHLCAVVEQRIVDRSEQPQGLGVHYRNIISSILANLEFLIESTIRKMGHTPFKVKNSIQKVIRYTKDFAFFAKSHKVLYQSGNAVLRYGISSEFAFPASGGKIVEVLEAIFSRADDNSREAGLYQSGHIPVRFVPPSRALLSSAYGRETAYIDVPLLYGTPGDLEILEGYQEMMIGLGGIPHWGKYNRRLYFHHDFIRSQFTRVNDWIDLRDGLDPRGTFLNDFVGQMGLTRLP